MLLLLILGLHISLLILFLLGGPWIGKSVRLSFPTDRDFDARVKKLVSNTRKVLTENSCSTVIRLGYSAIDFVTRPAKGIETFFMAEPNQSSPDPNSQKRRRVDHSAKMKPQQIKPIGIEAFLSTSKNKSSSKYIAKNSKQTIDNSESRCDIADAVKNASVVSESPEAQQKEKSLTDEEIAKQLQSAYDKEIRTNNTLASIQPKPEIDRDEAMAIKLQSTYDREHSVLSCVEKYSIGNKSKKIGQIKSQKGINKKSKIDSYFTFKK